MEVRVTSQSDTLCIAYSKRYHLNYTIIHNFRLFALFVLSVDYLIFAYTYKYDMPFIVMQTLTEWSYFLTFVYFIVSLIKKADQSVTLTHSPLFHICLSAEFLVVMFYWSVLFPLAEFENGYQLYLGCSRHLFPFMFIVIDYFINNIKLGFTTFRFVFAFLIIYMLNNLAFKIFFNISIYAVITWDCSLISTYKSCVCRGSLYTLFFGLVSVLTS